VHGAVRAEPGHEVGARVAPARLGLEAEDLPADEVAVQIDPVQGLQARAKAAAWGTAELVPMLVEPRRNCAVERAYVTLELGALCDLIDYVANRVHYLDERDPVG